MRDARALLWLLAIAAGLTAANLWYCQPLLAMMGASFGASPHQIGLVAVLTQAGYAAAMILVIPLGDSEERRRLMVISAAASAAALLAVALAPSMSVLLVASFALGLTTAVPQLSVPYAADLVDARERGRSVGKVMSGLLIGILLSRTASGLIGHHLGWRAVYFIASAVMLASAVLLRLLLPEQVPERRIRYRELLRSLPALLRNEPLLRRHGILGALALAAFSAFWTTLAFLLATPPYHYGADVAGLFGLVGVAGALIAPVAGGLADRYGTRLVNGLALACVLVSWMVFALFWRSLAGLAAGVLLLDLGVQANHISNQTRVLGLSTELRNRLNAVYMVMYFTGAAAGSFLGAGAFGVFGWTGVTALGIVLSAAALAAYFFVEADAAAAADHVARRAVAAPQ
jgi:predicted MFS family arabinose efflux permease